MEDKKKTKDVIYSDSSRATYLFEQVSKQYLETPDVIIRKNRLDDINIKAGVGLPEAQTFKTDIRISFSTEIP